MRGLDIIRRMEGIESIESIEYIEPNEFYLKVVSGKYMIQYNIDLTWDNNTITFYDKDWCIDICHDKQFCEIQI